VDDMRKTILVIGMIVLLLFLIKPSVESLKIEEFDHLHSNGNVLYVGGSGPGNYSVIQDAINDAVDGDTVFVFNGSSPYEECLEINRRISLIGEDKESTIIIGDCLETLITVRGREVFISGFTIKTSDSKRYPYYGIYIKRDGVTITNNIISNIETGISVNSHYNIITDNEFINCGIYATSSYYQNTISNNYVNGKPLIYRHNKNSEKITNAGQVILLNCINITIENANISDVYYGIYLKESNYCKIIGNNITNCNIFLVNSKKNEISGNIISKIERRTMYMEVGITLQYSNENEVIGNNIFSNEGIGIHIYYSNENIVENNNIESNRKAIDLDDANSNTITKNNFVGNIKNVHFLDCKGNRWTRNYWDRARILPKLITGSVTIVEPGFGTPGKYLPWFNFDILPVKIPYDIGV
jgi:parallel beta-helix repeat protein